MRMYADTRAAAARTTYTRATLPLHEYALLRRVNFAESGYLHGSHLSEAERATAGKLARKGLVERHHGYVEVTLAGRYVVEPEAAEELYGPQGY